jgi:hypothetical protein
MKIIAASHATNPLELAALEWLNERGADYENGAEGPAAELFQHGCISGIVSDLIYHVDCIAFAKLHLVEIMEALDEYADEVGEPLLPHNGMNWNCDWLAWAGFELAARKVCDRAGIEV